MKSILLFLGGLLILSCKTGYANTTADNQPKSKPDQSTANPMIIRSSPDLYDLTSSWAREFSRLNPEASITIDKFADDGSIS